MGGNPDVTPFLKGGVKPAEWQERGWKDTVMAPPGTITRIITRWAPTDGSSTTYAFDPSGAGIYNYVWHCHILDHEDNEMMRPDFIRAQSASRSFVKGREVTDYQRGSPVGHRSRPRRAARDGGSLRACRLFQPHSG